jgi:hypothetical protein
MIHFPKGGNWTDGAHAGLFSLTDRQTFYELVAPVIYDIDGLPHRWAEIMMGRTNWIPKIVFEQCAQKKRKQRSLTRDLSFFHFQSHRITFIRYALKSYA